MNLSTSSFKALFTAFALSCASLLLVLVAASEWLVRAKVAPADTMERHVALFSTTHSPYVAFGDSHVARGFNAAAPVVNLAYPSENLERIAWKAERYLNRVEAPKIILLQADPHLFAPYRLDVGLADYPEIFVQESGVSLKALSDRYKPQLLLLWRSFIANGGRMVSRIEQTPQGALLSPGNLDEWSKVRRDHFTEQRVSLHQPIRNMSSSAAADEYRAMVQAFLDSGAQICLVAFPTAPVYRAEVASLGGEKKNQWDEAMAFYRGLAAEPGVSFIDHRDAYADTSLFRDPDHLNKEGAIAYAPVLQEACFGNVDDSDYLERIATAR